MLILLYQEIFIVNSQTCDLFCTSCKYKNQCLTCQSEFAVENSLTIANSSKCVTSCPIDYLKRQDSTCSLSCVNKQYSDNIHRICRDVIDCPQLQQIGQQCTNEINCFNNLGNTNQHTSTIKYIVFDSTINCLFTVSINEQILWTLDTGELITIVEKTILILNNPKIDAPSDRIIGFNDTYLLALDRSSGALITEKQAHTAAITDFIIDLTSSKIISWSLDNTLAVFNYINLAFSTIKGHSLPVNGLMIDRKNNRLVTISQDKTFIVWDFITYNNLTQVEKSIYYDIGILENDKFYALSSTRLQIWNYPNSIQDIFAFAQIDISITGAKPLILFDKNTVKFYLYYRNESNVDQPITDSIKIIDFQQEVLAVIYTIKHDNLLVGLVLDDQNHQILSWCESNKLYLWQGESSNNIFKVEGHKDQIVAVVIDSAKNYFFSASKDQMILMWDYTTGAQIHKFYGHTFPIIKLVIDLTNKKVISIDNGNQIKFWNYNKFSIITTMQDSSQCNLMKLVEEADHLIVIIGKSLQKRDYTDNIIIKVYDLSLHTIQSDYSIKDVLVDYTNLILIAFTSNEEYASAWNYESGTFIKKLEGHGVFDGGSVMYLQGLLMPINIKNPTSFVTYGNKIIIWNYPQLTLKLEIQTRSQIAYYDTTRGIIISGYQEILRMFNATDGSLLIEKTKGGHTQDVLNHINQISYDPVSNHLYTCAWDTLVIQWLYTDLSIIDKKRDHGDEVNGCKIDLIKRRLITFSLDGVVIVWTLDPFILLYKVIAHPQKSVQNIVLDEYSNLLLTYANEKQVLVWNYQSGVVINRFNTSNNLGNIQLILDKRYNRIISCGAHSIEEFDFSPYIGKEDITLPNKYQQSGALDQSTQNSVYYADQKVIKIWNKQLDSLEIKVSAQSTLLGDSITGVYTEGADLLIYHNTQHIKFYNMTNKTELASFKIYPKFIYKDYFIKQLVIVSLNNSIYIIDYSQQHYSIVMQMNEHSSTVLGALINAEWMHVITYDASGKIIVWDIYSNNKMIPQSSSQHKSAVRGILIDNANSRLISWSDDSKIKFWNYVIDSITLWTQLNDHTTPVISLQLDATNNNMFSFARGQPIAVWKYSQQFISKYLLTPDSNEIILNLNPTLGLFLIQSPQQINIYSYNKSSSTNTLTYLNTIRHPEKLTLIRNHELMTSSILILTAESSLDVYVVSKSETKELLHAMLNQTRLLQKKNIQLPLGLQIELLGAARGQIINYKFGFTLTLDKIQECIYNVKYRSDDNLFHSEINNLDTTFTVLELTPKMVALYMSVLSQESIANLGTYSFSPVTEVFIVSSASNNQQTPINLTQNAMSNINSLRYELINVQLNVSQLNSRFISFTTQKEVKIVNVQIMGAINNLQFYFKGVTRVFIDRLKIFNTTINNSILFYFDDCQQIILNNLIIDKINISDSKIIKIVNNSIFIMNNCSISNINISNSFFKVAEHDDKEEELQLFLFDLATVQQQTYVNISIVNTTNLRFLMSRNIFIDNIQSTTSTSSQSVKQYLSDDQIEFVNSSFSLNHELTNLFQIDASNVKLHNLTITNNSCIVCEDSDEYILKIKNSVVLNLQNITFQSNSGIGLLLIEQSQAQLQILKFKNNTSSQVISAIYFKDANITLNNSQILENQVRKSTGFLLIQGCQYILIESTNMSRNTALKDNGLMRIDMSFMQIKKTRFTENQALGSIGVLTASDSTIAIYNSTFLKNYAKKQIGTLLIQESVAELDEVIFDSNYVYFGTIGVLSTSNTLISIQNSQFLNNSALEQCGALYFDSAEATLTNLTFIKNRAEKESGGSIVAQYSHIKSQNITFQNNSALLHGGSIYLMYSVLEISNIQFLFNIANTGSGGAIWIKNTTLYLSLVLFSKNNGSNSGALHILQTNNASINNCTFELNQATGGNGGAASILNCNDKLNNLKFNFCNFSYNIAGGSGGAIYFNETNKIDITNTNITNNKARIGGGIRYQTLIPSFINDTRSESQDSENQVNSQNLIQDNTADIFGADIASYPFKLMIVGVQQLDTQIFRMTQAKSGALHDESSPLIIKFLSEKEENIKYSSIAYKSYPQVLQEELQTYQIEFYDFVTSTDTSTNNVNSTTSSQSSTTNTSALRILSDGDFQYQEETITNQQIKCHQNNKRLRVAAGTGSTSNSTNSTNSTSSNSTNTTSNSTTSNSSESNATTTQNSSESNNEVPQVKIVGTIVQEFNQADQALHITNFKILGMPSQSGSVIIKSKAIYKPQYIYGNYTQIGYQLQLIFDFGSCEAGEIYKSNSEYLECYPCPLGFYSLIVPTIKQISDNSEDTNQTSCLQCPEVAQSCIGNRIILRNGFWRDFQAVNLTIVQCENLPENCLSNEKNYTENVCKKGHVGPLCEQCDVRGVYGAQRGYLGEKYIQNSQYKCTECSDKVGLMLYLVILMVFTCALFFYSVLQSGEQQIIVMKTRFMRILGFAFLGKSGEADQSSIFIKMLVNYMQIFAAMKGLKMNMSESVVYVQEKLGSPIQAIMFSLDCETTNMISEDIFPLLYVRLLWIISVPFIYGGIMMIIYWTAILMKKAYYSRAQVLSGFIVLFIFMQPSAVSTFMSYALCRPIGSLLLVTCDLTYECYTATHTGYLFMIILPVLFLWSGIVPAMLFVKLFRNRAKLGSSFIINLRYGYLFFEYRRLAYFWEFCKIIEKTFIVLALNLFDQYVKTKSVIVCLIMLTYLVSMIRWSPYASRQLNNIEQYATIVLIFTVLLALYQYQNIDNFQIVLCQFFLLIFNLTYVGSMLQMIITSNITLHWMINSFKIDLKLRFPSIFGTIKAIKDPMGAFRNWRKLRKHYTKWLNKKKVNKDLPFFNDDNMVKNKALQRRERHKKQSVKEQLVVDSEDSMPPSQDGGREQQPQRVARNKVVPINSRDKRKKYSNTGERKWRFRKIKAPTDAEFDQGGDRVDTDNKLVDQGNVQDLSVDLEERVTQ